MTQDVNANDVAAFLVEIIALILLGWWAWRVPTDGWWARALAVVVVIGSAMILWGLFAAPTATFDQPIMAVVVKVVVLGGSVLAGYAVLPNAVLASLWAVMVVANTVLIYVGPFARS